MLPSETHKENKKQGTIKCLIQSSFSSIAQLLAWYMYAMLWHWSVAQIYKLHKTSIFQQCPDSQKRDTNLQQNSPLNMNFKNQWQYTLQVCL